MWSGFMDMLSSNVLQQLDYPGALWIHNVQCKKPETFVEEPHHGRIESLFSSPHVRGSPGKLVPALQRHAGESTDPSCTCCLAIHRIASQVLYLLGYCGRKPIHALALTLIGGERSCKQNKTFKLEIAFLGPEDLCHSCKRDPTAPMENSERAAFRQVLSDDPK